MQVTVKNISKLERQLKINVPAKEIDAKTNKKLEELSKKAKIAGFRPGKVPINIIKQRYGEATRHDIIADIIEESYFKALEQEKLNPAGHPKIEPKESKFGEPLEYTATFEIYPEIEIKDLVGVKIEKITAKIEDKDIDNMLAKLQKQQSKWEEVKRSAKIGDQVIIDFEGKINGEVFAGGSSKDFKVELGAGTMLPDFEKPLVGVKAGDEVTLKVKFPKDYGDEHTAGKNAEFAVKVHKVLGSKLAEIDKEFLEKMGVKKGGVTELRKTMRTNMEHQLEQKTTMRLKNKILDKLLELNDFEVPKVLIEGEITRLQQQAKQQYMQYMQQMGKPAQELPDLPREEFTVEAQKRVKLGLLLGKLVERDKVKAAAAKIKAKIESFAAGYKDSAEVVKWYYNNKEHLAQIESVVMEEEVLSKLEQQAEIKEKIVNYEETINA